MDLRSFLKTNRKNILKKWYNHVCDIYQSETSHFLIDKKDPFANPVGSAIMKGLSAIIDVICGEIKKEEFLPLIDPIIRIRAVQNFSALESLRFILFLKDIIREKFYEDHNKADIIDELLSIESQIDELMLTAFGIYAECREKINDIKANELKNSTYKAFERAGLLANNEEEISRESDASQFNM